MSDEIAWFQDQLRQDPASPHLRRIIRRLRRFEKERGNAPKPSHRIIGQAKQHLFNELPIDGQYDLKISPKLPIDFLIRDFLKDHTIIESLDADPFLDGRQSVLDGCVWGDYYARLKLGKEPARRSHAKMAKSGAVAISRTILEFLSEHGEALTGIVADRATNHDDDTSLHSISSCLSDLTKAQASLDQLARACTSTVMTTGGNPGSPWRVGFVWGMGLGWRGLTGKTISPSSDRFLRFLEAGFASVRPEDASNSDNWTSAVRTAIKRFGVGSGTAWQRRPGEE